MKRNRLEINTYKVNNAKPKSDDARPVTIGLVSDLHDCMISEALEAMRSMKPDIILCPGDMLERYELPIDKKIILDKEVYNKQWLILVERFMSHVIGGVFRKFNGKKEFSAFAFFEELVKIAPTYYSLGNHEMFIARSDREKLDAIGVHTLENQSVELMLNGQKIIVGGSSDWPDYKWLGEFASQEGFRILMCHQPHYYKRIKNFANLIVCGHAHGGQIRFGNRGIFAPGQGFFPKYTKGLYDNKMIVSAGVAIRNGVPRWGNPLEVVQIVLGTVLLSHGASPCSTERPTVPRSVPLFQGAYLCSKERPFD